MGVIIDALNWIIAGFGAALQWIIGLLPISPFSTPSAPPAGVDLGYITWLIPFPTMLVHFSAVLSAVIVWYGIRIVARWVKLARG